MHAPPIYSAYSHMEGHVYTRIPPCTLCHMHTGGVRIYSRIRVDEALGQPTLQVIRRPICPACTQQTAELRLPRAPGTHGTQWFVT